MDPRNRNKRRTCENIKEGINELRGRRGEGAFALVAVEEYEGEEPCGDCGGASHYKIIESDETVKKNENVPKEWYYCGHCEIG